MGAMSSIKMELFDELEMSSTEKKILELTKLSDDDLYRMIGSAARNTSSSLKPSRDYLESPNIGDATGKSAFFLQKCEGNLYITCRIFRSSERLAGGREGGLWSDRRTFGQGGV